MAKGTNQKLKLLYLAKIFQERTDEEHGITMQELIAALNKQDIGADRKTIYTDLEDLRTFGMEIVGEKRDRTTYYKLISREFEVPELKLLIDSVQSAKFISERKSQALIKKLESLVSTHEAKQLQRQVLISGRIKSMNESVYYNVDRIHDAINRDVQIRFRYFQWNIQKQAELRRDGAWYYVSPWSLIWDDEYYYLIAFDRESQAIRHYRVDKMLKIEATDDLREGREEAKKIDLPKYSRRLFGMFSGTETQVTLRCKNWMSGVIVDRFGKDITLVPVNSEQFDVSVRVTDSGQFFGWVFSFGDAIRILSPTSMADAMKAELQKVTELYK